MSASSTDSSSSGFTQVGGHPGSISGTEDGSLLIKYSSPLEREFYAALAQARVLQSTSDSQSKIFAKLNELSRFVPRFYGTLKLEGEIDTDAMQAGDGGIVLKDVQPDTRSLVLENLLYTFLKPNILDLKLGQVLYDEEASEEKKMRMHKVAQETTSGECGMRLTGFQVHSQSPSSPEPIITPKSYGKSIRKDQLPEGIARVFPTASASTRAASTSQGSTSSGPTASTDSAPGLSSETLLPILRAIHSSTAHLRDVLASLEIRIVGGSLLVVYEGDEEKAREGVAWMKDWEKSVKDNVDDVDVLDDEGDSEDEDDDETSEDITIPSPYTVKLIDFAHTRFAPGLGPDEGVLLGLSTFLDLLEMRIKDVQSMIVGGQGGSDPV